MTARAATSGSYLVQYAPSGRSGCLECKQLIQKGELRLGAPLPETGRWQWRHWGCLTDAELGTVRQHVQHRGPKGLTGQEELSAEDQERVRHGVEAGDAHGAAFGGEQPAAAAGGAAAGRAAAARAAAEEGSSSDGDEEEEEEEEEKEDKPAKKKKQAKQEEEEEEEEEEEDDEYEPAPRIKTPRNVVVGSGRRLPSRRMAEKRRMAGDDEGDSDYDPRGDSRKKRAVPVRRGGGR